MNEYPLYKRYVSAPGDEGDFIVKFTDLSVGEVVEVIESGYRYVGECSDNWVAHTDKQIWKDCEALPSTKGLAPRIGTLVRFKASSNIYKVADRNNKGDFKLVGYENQGFHPSRLFCIAEDQSSAYLEGNGEATVKAPQPSELQHYDGTSSIPADIVPPLNGVPAYIATTTKTKENDMIEIIKTTPLAGEGKEFTTVNGTRIEALEEGQILAFIDSQEREIAKLTAVKRVPVKMKNKVARLRKDLKTFIDLLDSLEEA